MLALDHDHHAQRIEVLLQRVRDLVGEALLHLQAAREHIHDARNLAQADHLVTRDVGDMRLADERQHVMFAHRVVLDISHDDHFTLAVFHLEHRAVDDRLDVLTVAFEQLIVHLGDPVRRAQQAIPVGVFAHLQQDQAHRIFDFFAGIGLLHFEVWQHGERMTIPVTVRFHNS